MYDSLALYRRDGAKIISNAQVSCFGIFMIIMPAFIRQVQYATQYLKMREMKALLH